MKWLYKIINTVSGKEYIGVTIDPKRRWKQHKSLKGNCVAIRDAMKKYGVDKFKFTILCCGEDQYIDDLETKAISLYKTQIPDGYNITLGGEGTLYYSWDDEWNSLLGTTTDRELSKKLNIPHETIGSRRKALGIPTYGEVNKINWEDFREDFKYKTDSDIADITGWTESWVQKVRLDMGIKKREKHKDVEITNDMKEILLDVELSQTEVARIIGHSRSFVNTWRKRNNVISKHNRYRKPLPENVIEDILDRTNTIKDLTLKYNISRSYVSDIRKMYKEEV